MIRLPTHYTLQRYCQENYNSTCIDSLIEDTRYDFLEPIKTEVMELSPDMRFKENKAHIDTIKTILKKNLVTLSESSKINELEVMEEEHKLMSIILGIPVGIAKEKGFKVLNLKAF